MRKTKIVFTLLIVLVFSLVNIDLASASSDMTTTPVCTPGLLFSQQVNTCRIKDNVFLQVYPDNAFIFIQDVGNLYIRLTEIALNPGSNKLVTLSHTGIKGAILMKLKVTESTAIRIEEISTSGNYTATDLTCARSNRTSLYFLKSSPNKYITGPDVIVDFTGMYPSKLIYLYTEGVYITPVISQANRPDLYKPLVTLPPTLRSTQFKVHTTNYKNLPFIATYNITNCGGSLFSISYTFYEQ